MESQLASVIEIGSRGIRLAVGRISDGSLNVVTRRYESHTRLVDVVDTPTEVMIDRVVTVRHVVDAFIREATVDSGVAPSRIWVVGTATVRYLKAASDRAFRVLSHGFELSARPSRNAVPHGDAPKLLVLTPKEEARYALATAMRSLFRTPTSRQIVAIDQGAGSLEVAAGKQVAGQVQLLGHRSYPFGTETLLRELHARNDDYAMLRAWIESTLGAETVRGSKSASDTVALGSAATKMGWLIATMGRAGRGSYHPEAVHGVTVRSVEVRQVLEAAISPSPQFRDLVDRSGAREGDFESIVVGLTALYVVLSSLDVSEFVVCAEGLRYGLLWDLAAM